MGTAYVQCQYHRTRCYGALVSENCLLEADQAKNQAQLH